MSHTHGTDVPMPPITHGQPEKTWRRLYIGLSRTIWSEAFQLAVRNWCLESWAEATPAELELLESGLLKVWWHGLMAYLARRRAEESEFGARLEAAFHAFKAAGDDDKAGQDAVYRALGGGPQ